MTYLKYNVYTVRLVGCVMRRQRGHLEMAPHLLSLAKDVKLGYYTIPTGNRALGHHMAVLYTTVAP